MGVRLPLLPLLPLVFAATAWAGPVVRDAELDDARAELRRAIVRHLVTDRPVADLVPEYRERLARARTPRDTAIAHLLLGELLHRADRPGAAVGQLQLALFEVDAFPLAHALLGRFYLDEGNVPEAREAFERCLELEPGRADATVGLAVAGLRSGSAPGVARARTLLEPLAATNAEAATWLAMALLKLAQDAGDPDEAAALRNQAWERARGAVARAPGRADARAAFATALRSLPVPGAAEPAYAATMRGLADPDDARAVATTVAEVLRRTGVPDAAGRWLHVAVRAQPALRDFVALQRALAGTLGTDGARETRDAAAGTCRARLDEDARPLPLRRIEALLLRTVYLPWFRTDGDGETGSRPEARRCYAALFRELAGGDAGLRGEALRLAADFPNPKTLPILARVLERELAAGAGNAALAARALGEAGGAAAIPALLRCLDGAGPDARAEAHRQLARVTVAPDPAGTVQDDPAAYWRGVLLAGRGTEELRAGLRALSRLTRTRAPGERWTRVDRATAWQVLATVLAPPPADEELRELAWTVVAADLGGDPRAALPPGDAGDPAAAVRRRFTDGGGR